MVTKKSEFTALIRFHFDLDFDFENLFISSV